MFQKKPAIVPTQVPHEEKLELELDNENPVDAKKLKKQKMFAIDDDDSETNTTEEIKAKSENQPPIKKEPVKYSIVRRNNNLLGRHSRQERDSNIL